MRVNSIHAGLLFLLLITVALTGCDAKIRTASDVTATSARLNAVGRSECGQGGVFRFEYAKSKATVGSGNGTRTPLQAFGQTGQACTNPSSMAPFGKAVSGLTARTNYWYRLCGHDADKTAFVCTSTSQFTTAEPAGSLQPAVVINGSNLVAGGKPFRVYGFNLPVEVGPNKYLANPSLANWYGAVIGMRNARVLGANVARVHLQLFDFVSRDATGKLVMDQTRVEAFRTLLAEGQRQHLYFDVVGNNVWFDNAAPAWYDEMTYQQRWDVQAFFFSELAKVGKSYTSVFCWELTNEPMVRTSATDSWYGGSLGGYHFSQVIARGVPTTQTNEVAKAWMTKLRNAIRLHDTKHPVTIGGLPFNGGSFSATQQNAVLDVLSVHIYVKGTDVAAGVKLAQAFGSQGKPMFIGETSLWQSGKVAQRDFLLQQHPYSDGVISFFAGIGPDDQVIKTMADAVQQANTQLFVSMRPQLMP